MSFTELCSSVIWRHPDGYDQDYFTLTESTQIWQEFELPSDYVRTDSQPLDQTSPPQPPAPNPPPEAIGETTEVVNGRLITTYVPPLTGLQVLCGVGQGLADTAAIDWQIDHYTQGGWKTLVSGTQLGAHVDSREVWFDIYFDHPVPIHADWVHDLFRFGVTPHFNPKPKKDIRCQYEAGWVHFPWSWQYWVGYNWRYYVRFVSYLNRGYRIWFDDYGIPFYSECGGIDRFWYAYGTPYKWGCYTNDGPIQHNGQNTTLKFRLLAGVGTSGQDILNNPQSSIIVAKPSSNLDTFTDKKQSDFWLSKPNPSAFAVETLYFDLSNGDQPVVIDNIYLDPLTTGIYFNVYYSNDPNPGNDVYSWDALFWTHVPKTYSLTQAQNYVLPSPITAKYVAIEFSHLKAEQYDPGIYPTPIKYRKHPKWVLDYFVLRQMSDRRFSEDTFVANSVQVNYDALDLAYNYYLDDINQQPEGFAQLTPNTNTNFLSQYLTSKADTSDQVDPQTLAKISLAFQPFTFAPGVNTPFNSILSFYSQSAATTNYPVEVATPTPPAPADVSSLRRENIVYEKSMPVMFFYVTSRHLYREVSASLNYNRAYFAGLKSVAFTRNKYTVQADDPLYIEPVGDNTNTVRNDFFTDVDFTWIAHGTNPVKPPPPPLVGTLYPDPSIYPDPTLFPTP